MPVKVLLVDKREEASAALAGRLRRMPGIELIGAVQDEAGAAIALAGARPDVVLIDLHGPHAEGDATRLCGELRRLAAAPLVVLASFLSPEQREELRGAGVASCVLKQVDSERLGQELVSVGRQSRSAERAREGQP